MSERAGKTKRSRLGWLLYLPAMIALDGSASAAKAQLAFEAAYFYKRTIVTELLIKEAITKRSTDRALTLYHSLFDESLVLAAQTKSEGVCFEAFSAMIPVALMAYGRLSPEEAHKNGPVPTVSEANASIDRAWTFYQDRRNACEHLQGRVETARILPERLSEAF